MKLQVHTRSVFAVLIALAAPLASAAEVATLAIGEAVERQLPDDRPYMQWVQDPERINELAGDRLGERETQVEELETVKLTGLVAPIHFESGVAQIPDDTVQSLARILAEMRERRNVRLHLIGHADNQPLSAALAARYGDNFGLSRERAGEVAEYFKNALALSPESISYEWAGDTKPVASNLTAEGRAQNRRVEVEVWYDEVRQRPETEEVLVTDNMKRVKVCRTQTVCKLRYTEGLAHRARIRNLITPLRYDEEGIEVDAGFVDQVRRALENLGDRENVVVRFVGFTDDAPLSPRMERIYGSHDGLSRARARRVALAMRDALDLPGSSIESDGGGADRPLGSNATAEGRALNRRVEVEFWYDDPLQELPDEPQICPDAGEPEVVTKVYEPSWGRLADLEIADGQPLLPAGYLDQVKRALGEVTERENVRLRFTGYTHNEQLARRTAGVYGDDIGLSAARARRAMEHVRDSLGDEAPQTEFEGQGFVQSDDVVNSGFTQEGSSHVKVEVVYDDRVRSDRLDDLDIKQLTREITPRNPLGLNLMRITVDGVPIDDPERSSADIQRCTDVAMEHAGVSFSFDNLRSSPRLSVAAGPSHVRVVQTDGRETVESPVSFRMYTNYAHFIERSEVRVFEKGASLQSQPFGVIPIGSDGRGVWTPELGGLASPVREFDYVLRAYGHDGHFDETTPQSVWFVRAGTGAGDGEASPANGEPETLAAYGENTLGVHNIGLGSGTVRAHGSGVPADSRIWLAGHEVPVDANGEFVAEQILPVGLHTVEVARLNEEGDGELYLRDLELKKNDWFYVGMADVTLAQNSTSGAIDLMQGDGAKQKADSNFDGRLAFYVDGEFASGWKMTASADTREGPIEDLFSNFLDKSPDALFRRIDPDYYYPTFGDDGVVEERAPTMGKFFVRVSEKDRYAEWGNFSVGYNDNELAQVDRGLYGSNVHFTSDASTSFGERRFAIDAFAAEPGTLAGRDEFRGTGGSLYFLERQDIVTGSERVRVEVRNRTTGLVTGVTSLTPGTDYDIDYIQGRIVLTQPLVSSASDNRLVRGDELVENERYLVVRYEYSPGFDEIDDLALGGQAHYWFGDHVRAGLTASSNSGGESNTALNAADLTLRYAPKTWLKLQYAQTEGVDLMPTYSADGGYQFVSQDPLAFADRTAAANRIDLSLSSRELLGRGDGDLTLYVQGVDAGYAAPGLMTLSDTTTYGASFTMSVAERGTVSAKMDRRRPDAGVEMDSQELDLGYRFTPRWDAKMGVRRDERTDRSPVTLATQEQGQRTDATLQLGFDPLSDWNAYVFVQDSLTTTGNRSENSRAGLGGDYRMSDKMEFGFEVSDGDLGPGARLGSKYLYSERTSLYLNYALDNERADAATQATRGGSNLTAGIKSRVADSTSVFLEERYQATSALTGLTHATGISFTPVQRWNIGLTTDVGTLVDAQTGAETKRMAVAMQASFDLDALQVSSGIEYRNDDAEQLDLTRTERTTWLYRSDLRYQINPGSRLLAKFNHSVSESSLGTFFEGGYTEAVIGYAYRPVEHDRLNALVKMTYFYNVPTSEQLTLQNDPAMFIQKSRIAAVDIDYDITPHFTLGGKYAYRFGELNLDRDGGQFVDNDAALYVLRGDYRLFDLWHVMGEGRLLDMRQTEGRKSGAMLLVTREFGKHVKAGVGYNFTDFSDDLTHLDYDQQGFFINVTGSM